MEVAIAFGELAVRIGMEITNQDQRVLSRINPKPQLA
jgi:hypothetical protein